MKNLALAMALSTLMSAPVPDPAAGVRAKIRTIQDRKARRGSDILFTERELNLYARSELPLAIPSGVRQPRVELGQGTATGYALIDFRKLQQGSDTPWLITKLIEGERPVRVSARVESGNGKATIFLQRVEISGIGVSGATLEFLIDNFFRPLFPDAKINQPFDLGPQVERVAVVPAAAHVILRR